LGKAYTYLRMSSLLRRIALASPTLRRFSSVDAPKTTTGLAGVNVVPNARAVLESLYKKTIRTARAFDDVYYNQHIIKLSQYRMDIVQKNESLREIEKQIGMGQVEELIEQAEGELELLHLMNEDFRPWEPAPESKAEMAEWGPTGWAKYLPKPTEEELKAAGITTMPPPYDPKTYPLPPAAPASTPTPTLASK